MSINEYQVKEPLPIEVIMNAIGGDEAAIKTVVKHYGQYIEALATKRLYDEEGRQYLFVDDELSHELELKLITKLATFKAKAA
jgi:hypothetical protein